MRSEPGLRVAFVAGLTDKKLGQKLSPLLENPAVAKVELFRRAPYPAGGKLRVFGVGWLGRRFPVLGELVRLCRLTWRAWRSDVVVGCFQLNHGIMAQLAGRLWGKPVIQLVITDVDWNLERPLARWAMLAADACGVRGPGSLARLRTLGFAGPLAVIHNPVSLPPSAPARDLEHDLIAVGDFAVEKDYPTLLTALARLTNRFPNLRGLICGRGFPGPLASQLDRLGLGDALTFPGHLDDAALARAYAGAGILVLSSRVEGLPMVVVEAMRQGLAVVATDVGEMSWLVRDGIEGRLVPAGEPAALAEALAELLENPVLRRDMGENGRRRIEALAPEFSLPRIMAAWEILLGLSRERQP